MPQQQPIDLQIKTMTTKTNWVIDAQHSVVNFKVKHLAIANVSGTFKIFKGNAISKTEDFDDTEISFEINTNSIDTNNPERDGHLKSQIFLNSEIFPKIEFKGILGKTDGEYKLVGDLTILETTNKIQLDVEHTGIGKGRFDDVRAGFEVSGKINRRDFGLQFHLLNEAGNLVVGNDIKLNCDIELIKEA
jgi:polyisoprenoid-binding protein YceI